MATTERNRITGFFVIGFLVGLITMWALVRSGTFRVKADIDYTELFKCIDETIQFEFTDTDGDGDVDLQDIDRDGDGDFDFDDLPPEVQNDLRRCLAIAGGSEEDIPR